MNWRRKLVRHLPPALGIALSLLVAVPLLTSSRPVALDNKDVTPISLTELAPNTTTGGINIDVRNATQEVGEVNAATGRSAWWKYTPTSNYSVSLLTAGWIGELASCVTTMIGSCSVANNSNNGTWTYALTGGTPYYFRFAANGEDRGTFTLSRGTYTDTVVPTNNAFANATPIGELAAGTDTGGLNVSLANATTEAGEAAVAGTAKTLWWKYTPSSDYVVNLIVRGWTANMASCITTAFGSCSVASNPSSGIFAYALTGGTTYYVRLNPNNNDLGTFIFARAGTDNDAFANATAIPEPALGSKTAPITVDVTNGTIEPGEVNSGFARSRWWSYTPSTSGLINVEFRAGGSLGQCFTTVITSCSIGSGSPIGAYNVTAGTTYFLRINKLSLGSDDGVFSVLRAANDNDLFANAVDIPEVAAGSSSAPVTFDVTNATIEPNEFNPNTAHSRWWKYTPSATQLVNVVSGSSYNAGVCVTRNTTSCSEGNAPIGAYPYTFTANTTYYLRVSGVDTNDGYLFISRGGAGNDNFVDATAVAELASGGSMVLGVDLRDATIETGEVGYGYRQSKWWKYTPTVSTNLSVMVSTGNSFGVCVTRVWNACEQAQNGGGNGTFGAALVANTPYYVRVSNNPGEIGTITLSRDSGGNDMFANATVITELAPGTSTTPILFSAIGATAEPGEISYGNNRSRWWKYTPTVTTSISVTVNGSTSGLAYCVTVSISSCSLFASGPSNATTGVSVTANIPYYLRIVDYAATEGTFILSAAGADNDQFANATAVPEIGMNATTTPTRIDLAGASQEANETLYGLGESRWWKYTPTTSYTLDVTTLGPRDITKCVTTVITGCTTGQGFSGKTGIALTANTTYFIRIDSYGAKRGWLILSRGTVPAAANPANDAFASATAINELSTGAEYSTTFDLTNSTSQSGEVSSGGLKSQWWSYAPSQTQTVNVATMGAAGQLAVCVTTALASCSEGSSSTVGTSAFSFTAGTTYYIRISNTGGVTGAFALAREQAGNDRFLAATDIPELAAGARLTTGVDFTNATLESGEVSLGWDRSLWWKYTTTSAQLINVAMAQRDGSSYLCITVSIGSCSVASGSTNPVSANLSASTTYYIRLTGDRAQFSTFGLSRAASTGDRFADAVTISELSAGTSAPTQRAALTVDTYEPNESRPGAVGSAWWKYTPNTAYSVTLSAESAFTNSRFCVTEVITGCSVGSQTSGVKAYALNAGTTYYIQATSDTPQLVGFTLTRGGLANDDFANATAMSELAPTTKTPVIPFDASTASAESPESGSTFGRTLWWKYSTTSAHQLTLSSYAHVSDNEICVTTSIGSCSVTSNNLKGTVAFSLAANTTYYVRMSARSNARGAFALSRSIATNDEIANATNISELAEGTRAPTYGAHFEQATPDAGASTGLATLWWKYTPSITQTVNVDFTTGGGVGASCVTTVINTCSVAYNGSSGRYVYALTGGTTYYFGAGITSGAGPFITFNLSRVNTSTNDAFANATPVLQYDVTAPTAGTVFDGSVTGVQQRTSGTSLTELSANWPGFSDAGTGIDNYQYAIGTTPGGTDIRTWTTTPSASITATGLSLVTSTTYYVSVKAVDAAGNVSAISTSAGQSVTPLVALTLSGLSSGSACGDVTTTVGSDASTVSFGTLTGGSAKTVAAQDVSVTTNARNGFTVTIASSGFAGPVAIPAVSGTNASPAGWPSTGTPGFGYTSSATNLGANPNRFHPSAWAGFGSSSDPVAFGTGTSMTATHTCIAVGVSTATTTPAGTYTGTVRYTLIPTF